MSKYYGVFDLIPTGEYIVLYMLPSYTGKYW